MVQNQLEVTAKPAPARRGKRPLLWVKVLLWALCLTPLGLLVWRGLHGKLTANPVEFIQHKTGFWALTLIMVTLSITPLRRITGWNRIIQLRRPLGLFAFFYATIHFLTYIVFDQFFDVRAMIDDIAKRPYITVGFPAFVLLIPLAITSTKGWIRRLGKRWQLIHKLVYVSSALAVLHFYWKRSAKHNIEEPLIFGAILLVLLGFRALWFRREWVFGRASAASFSHKGTKKGRQDTKVFTQSREGAEPQR